MTKERLTKEQFKYYYNLYKNNNDEEARNILINYNRLLVASRVSRKSF